MMIRWNLDKFSNSGVKMNLIEPIGNFGSLECSGVENIGNFLCTFKNRVKDIYVHEWHARLENSTRARFYINVAKFQFQKYLDLLKIEKYRKGLYKLRVCSHRLEIETGRWAKPNKIPLDNRKCMICNVLEDEFHFVLECSFYKDLKKKHI